MAENRMPINAFYVDFDVRFMKWGMELRPLVICERGILIGEKTRKFGFWQYLFDRVLWSSIFSLSLSALNRSDLTGAFWQDDAELINDKKYDEVLFEDFRGFSLNVPRVGDVAIEIFYHQGSRMGRLSFYVANQYSCLPEQTKMLYHILKERVGS